MPNVFCLIVVFILFYIINIVNMPEMAHVWINKNYSILLIAICVAPITQLRTCAMKNTHIQEKTPNIEIRFFQP